MSQSLFLIDSSALAYRAFYAFIKNPLKDSRGRQTSALFGYATQILRLLFAERPSHLAIVQDLRGPTFRHEIFPQYKATRKPMPEEMVEQLPAIDDFIRLSGLPVVSSPGYEADDLMATLSLQAEEAGLVVNLVTRDKDMMQIVGDRIRLYEAGARNQPAEVRGPEAVISKFGVRPEQIVDFLALMGDASDNIPGVKKVGQKTAAELLNTYGTLDAIYENLDKIKRKALKENLTRDRDNAYLSRRLVTLDSSVPLKKTMDDFAVKPLDINKMTVFLREWELNSLAVFLESHREQAAPVAPDGKRPGQYTLVAPGTESDFTLALSAAEIIALDTETTGLNPLSAGLVGLCFSTFPNTGWYLPLGHSGGSNYPLESVKTMLQPVLSDRARTFVFHNAKYDLTLLDRHGLSPEGTVVDTLIAGYLLNPGSRGLSLDALAKEHFNHNMITIESLIGKKGKNQLGFDQVPVEKACKYGAEDADITLRLWRRFEPQLHDQGLFELFRDVEMGLVPVLQKMEWRGICLDSNALRQLSTTLATDLERLKADVHRLAGESFNLESPQQLGKILFEKLGLPPGKKTKTGFSTDAEVLQKLKGKHDIIGRLLDFRELTKLKNTYVDVLPGLVNGRTGRIHTSYSQTIAATGRLSSLNPNLQNIPIRTEQGRRIRSSFAARGGGYLLMAADYSQIELRILAHLSGDPDLQEAFRENRDIHGRTAAALFNLPENKVTPDMRRDAKVVNFGIIYGMGARRLAWELNISQSKAADFIQNYFNRYTRVKSFMRETVDTARKTGYVTTLSGRKRFLPELSSGNRLVQTNAERMAANTPIQGSAADLIKKAMIDIDTALSRTNIDCDMLLQVHDELVFEVSKQDLQRASVLVRDKMENAMAFTVPLKVDVGAGHNWLEAHG